MRKKMFSFKNFVMLFMAIGLLTSVGCSKQDNSNEEINALKKEVADLRTDLAKDFQSKIDAKVKGLQDQLDNAKAKLEELSKKEGVTPAELKAAKEEVISAVVTKEAFETFKKTMNSMIDKAATKEAVDALKGKLEQAESKIATLETTVGANKASLDEALAELKKEFQASGKASVDAAVSDLEGKIAENKAALETLLNDYKVVVNAEFEKLNASIEANKTMSEANKEKTEANATKLKELEDKFNDLVEGQLGISVFSMLNSRLTSLVMLPEYVSSQGGSLPLVQFYPLMITCTDYEVEDPTDNKRKIPYTYTADGAVYLKYVVSPSTVTEEDIDIDNLKLLYNDPKALTRKEAEKSQAEKVEAKAEFVSLKKGILTVRVSAKVTETWAYKRLGDGKVDQIMLQVSTVSGKGDSGELKFDAVVSSDWAQIIYEEKKPTLVKNVDSTSDVVWDNYELSSTMSEAQDLADNDDKVIYMEYNNPLDLKEAVKSMMYSDARLGKVWNDLNLEDYNFDITFDLNNHENDNKAIVYEKGDGASVEKTDQQQFIKLEGSIAQARVYDAAETLRSAIGRTPIVHVILKTKNAEANSCTIKHAYIKLKIVEKKQEPIFYPKEVTYEAGCGGVIASIKTQEANEKLYSLVGLTREEFYEDYVKEEVQYSNLPESVKAKNKDLVYKGTIELRKDQATVGVTGNNHLSDNIVYVVGHDEVIANIGKTVWQRVKLKSKSGRRDIILDFVVKIEKEVASLNILYDNYGYGKDSEGKVTHLILNSSVPEKGSNVTYATDLRTAFNTKTVASEEEIDLSFGYKDKEEGKFDDYTYKFAFVEDVQPINEVEITYKGKEAVLKTKVINEGTELQVAVLKKSDNKVELNAYETVATITGGKLVTYSHTSDLAKYLLNYGPEFMKARLVLNVYNACNTPQGDKVNVEVKNLKDKDSFNVHFLRPVSLKAVSDKYFVDGVDVGKKGSVIDLTDLANPYDWRVVVKKNNGYYFNKNGDDYYNYYELNKVTGFNVDVNEITVTGLTVGGEDVKKLKPGVVEFSAGKLTYHNQDLNLNTAFTLHVPVTAEYKYGTVKQIIEVEVRPTETTNARKAAK